ncbi:MAG: hypothetical protein K6L81_14845 [Agarilytica sp.]
MSSIPRLSTRIFLFIVVLTSFWGCGGSPGESSGVVATATISFDSQTLEALTLKGQGGEETSVVTFMVEDLSGAGLSGEDVDFELSSEAGGAQLLNSSGTTDSSGAVSVAVQSGTVAVAVHVTATIRGTDIAATSDGIQISTSSFIASSFPLTAIVEDGIAPGADAAGSLIDVLKAGDLQGIPVSLQMITADQFGHKVRDGRIVTIVSPESGLVEPSTCALEGGVCSTTWTSTESGIAGTVVTLLAHASGAESFQDANGNNVYDLGETFVDLGEPFADLNDNGVFEAGVDYFFDSNSNGTYDSLGNGLWDGPCVVEDTSLCLGEDSTMIWTTMRLRLLACGTPDCSD